MNTISYLCILRITANYIHESFVCKMVAIFIYASYKNRRAE